MTEKRYVRFDERQDNTSEIISADHMNQLQDVSEQSQQDIFKQKDYDFLDRTLFTLDNHRKLNSLWIDTFEDTSKVDLSRTTHLEYSQVEQGVVFQEGSLMQETYIFSEPYINANGVQIKKALLVARTFKPEGTDIIIEASNNNADWFALTVNDSEPFEFPTLGTRLILRAKFIRQDLNTSPRLDGWGLLFYDSSLDIVELKDGSTVTIGDGDGDGSPDLLDIQHSELKGIGPDDHHPQEHTHDGTDGSGRVNHAHLTGIGEDDHHSKDHRHGKDGVDYVHLDTDVVGTLPMEHMSHRIWTGKPGDTGLYFDPNLEDKLVYVKTPDDETYLFYDFDNEGRLGHTITITRGIAIWEKLIYGEYLNSQGETSIVLSGTEKFHYDAIDSVIQDEINKITAPPAIEGVLATDIGTGDTIELTWVDSTAFDLSGYNIYISTNGSNFSRANTSIIHTNGFSVGGLVDGSTYYFYVTALDIDGKESDPSIIVEATPSSIDVTPPSKPQNVSSTLEFGQIRISWDANPESDLGGYKVYRSTSGAVGTFGLLFDVSVTNVLDTSVLAGNTYYYYVAAYDTSGNESINSSVISVSI